MIAMPVLSQEEDHQTDPPDIARGILARRHTPLRVTDAIDQTGRVEREHKPYRSQPKEGGGTETGSAEIREQKHRDQEPIPDAEREIPKVSDVLRAKRIVRLPVPGDMRPPQSQPDRTRRIIRRVGPRMVKAMSGYPTAWWCGSIEHREEDHKSSNRRMEPHRPVGQRTMVTNRGPDATEKSEHRKR